jgi:hypothetical protein
MRTRPLLAPLLALFVHGAPAAAQAPADAPATPPVAAPRAEPGDSDPLAFFAPLIGGEWRMSLETGFGLINSLRRGPGGHSIVDDVHGTDGEGRPWRSLNVFYWHPGLKQVRQLGLLPDIPTLGRGVGEGSVELAGEAARGSFGLYQPGHRGQQRSLGQRWRFEGPDHFVSTLLEDSGSGEFELLGEWQHLRSRELTRVPDAPGEAARPSGPMQALDPLLGSWRGHGLGPAGEELALETSLEWIPYVAALRARVVAPAPSGEPEHLLDAVLYHHPATDTLHALALSADGGVHEGTAQVLEGGALQLDLKRYHGDRLVPLGVRLDPVQDGTLRARAWALEGSDRALLLDVRHERLERR